MKCPVCGQESAEGTALCLGCGSALDRTLADSGRGRGGPDASGATRLLRDRREEAGRPPAPRPASRPPGEVAARCLLSSVLADPVRLDEGTFYRVGRDRTSDICFPSTHVSRLHAEIAFERGQWVVGDLGSKNGTTVNGERVLKRSLRDGDRIGIGHFDLLYRELSRPELEALRSKKKDRLTDTLKITQDEVGFFGDVRRLSVVEVVQLLGQNRKTGILTVVEEKGMERRLALVEGQVVHAAAEGLLGEEAAFAVLALRTGKFAFRPTPEAGEQRTIATPTPTLLLKAMETMPP